MPVLETKGAISAQGFGLTLQQGEVNYIEDVFSTWLYTGTGANQTITNGIDLAGKGGLVWNKSRSNSFSHSLIDTVRGAGIPLFSNAASAQQTSGYTNSLTGFTSTGFTLGSDSQGLVNNNGFTYASWTFREQPKFFDIVTYTGDGSNRTIAHNLGSVPGCIIVKKTSGADNWMVYHRSVVASDFLMLNTTNAAINSAAVWNSTAPTSTVFSVGTDTSVNQSGATYVAYLFAHNAGGFGLTGTDNVISCGTYTGTGAAGNAINLGYEPQLVIIKGTSIATGWSMLDSMRGFTVEGADALLTANTSSIESSVTWVSPTATGFSFETGSSNVNASGNTYVYIAIRRGPMKVPTTGTSVFAPATRTGTGGTSYSVTTNTTPDSIWLGGRTQARGYLFFDRLRGLPPFLRPYGEFAEVNNAGYITSMTNQGYISGTDVFMNGSGELYIDYLFTRAPGFFDEVCYAGNNESPTRQITHNLGVAPELGIVKNRTINPTAWPVRCSAAPAGSESFFLNTTDSGASYGGGYITGFTSTSFTVASDQLVNNSGSNYVAYLFASCPGVSKVGSYTGTGAVQVINCGFTGGARFVLIKARSSAGAWYVWDSARGIVAGNDPYLTLNTTNAEVTNTDWVDTAATGFELSNAGGNLANSNGVSYIFLAIS